MQSCSSLHAGADIGATTQQGTKTDAIVLACPTGTYDASFSSNSVNDVCKP